MSNPPISFTLPKIHKYVKSLPAVARHLKMAESTLDNWATLGEIKRTRNGYWSTKTITEYVIRKNLVRVGDTGNEDGEYDIGNQDPNKDNIELKLKYIKLKNAELEYDVKRGNVISRSEVEKMFVDKILVLRQSLLTLGRELAPVLAQTDSAPECKDIIDRAIEYRIRIFASQEDGESDD